LAHLTEFSGTGVEAFQPVRQRRSPATSNVLMSESNFALRNSDDCSIMRGDIVKDSSQVLDILEGPDESSLGWKRRVIDNGIIQIYFVANCIML
jgi:hypothetical protein